MWQLLSWPKQDSAFLTDPLPLSANPAGLLTKSEYLVRELAWSEHKANIQCRPKRRRRTLRRGQQQRLPRLEHRRREVVELPHLSDNIARIAFGVRVGD